MADAGKFLSGQKGTSKPEIKGRSALRFGIGVRFLSLVVLIALLSGGIVGIMLTNASRNSLRQQALNTNLEQADLAAAFASNYIKAVQAHVKVFSMRPDVRQAILNGSPHEIQSTLVQFVEVQTALDSCGIYDLSGIQQAVSVAGSSTIGQSFADRDWFQQVVATGLPSQGAPVFSRSTGKPVVPYAVPMMGNNGYLAGLLSANISLAALSESIVEVDFGFGTEALIIDVRDGGLVIADSEPGHLLSKPSSGNEALNRLLAGERGAMEITVDGESGLAGYAPVPGLPWGIIVVTPGKTALATVQTLTRDAILYTGLAVLLAVVLGVVLVLSVTRPLRRLVDGVNEIGRGNLNYEVSLEQKDEIGDLSRAFGAMAQNLNSTLVSRNELARENVERRRAEEGLRKALEELKRSNEELQRFAHVASHDLQEPLRMVASYVQLLERRYRDRLDADAHDFINFAVDGTKRMQELIDDLLTYSRVGSRGGPLEPTDMEAVLEAATNNLKVAIEEGKAEVTHSPLPAVMADEGQMIRVLQNLIGNAIKFHGTELPRIHISATLSGGEWVFSVRDNGIGIEPQYFDRIFIIFQRLHGQGYPGTGAGLSIAKRIIERHGGRIWVESAPGKGSTFYFSIPNKEGR